MKAGWICNAPRVGDDHESGTFAADEPTAMWDEESLQDLALDAPAEQQQSGAATRGQGGGGPSVQVELQSAGTSGPSKGLSWGITIFLALGLGAGVYFLIRFLKG